MIETVPRNFGKNKNKVIKEVNLELEDTPDISCY